MMQSMTRQNFSKTKDFENYPEGENPRVACAVTALVLGIIEDGSRTRAAGRFSQVPAAERCPLPCLARAGQQHALHCLEKQHLGETPLIPSDRILEQAETKAAPCLEKSSPRNCLTGDKARGF